MTAVPARRLTLGRFELTPWSATLILAAVAGVALRVWDYRLLLGRPNSDEAVVGLMTSHALHGDISVFFWGSSYGGPQEVLLSVPLFAVFGNSYLALRLVAIALVAVASLVVWRVGKRTLGEPGATAAAAILWVWSPYDLVQLTQQQSFYASDVVYCGLVLLLALRIAERPDRLRIGLFGFVVGFGFWQTAQIVPIVFPAVVWLTWKRAAWLREAWLAAVLAVVGASPWLLWNAFHGWASLSVHSSAETYRQSLRLFVSPILPMTLGLRAPFGQEPLLGSTAPTYALYALLIVAFLAGAVRTRHRTVSILYVVGALFPFVYAVDRRTSFISGWPQYTVIVTPVLALLLAQVASRRWRAIALVTLLALVTCISVPRMNRWFTLAQPVPYAPRDFSPLIQTLDNLGIDRVYADYWIAYRLDFASNEQIVAVEAHFDQATFPHGLAVLPHDPDARYRPYERTVMADPRHGFVFFKRTLASYGVAPQLEAHGYTRHDVGPLVVFAPPAGG